MPANSESKQTIPVRDSARGATFAVRVHPRARRTAITGVVSEGDDAVLKVALAAPPVDGRANEALIEFLAEVFEVPRSAIIVVAGERSRSKVIAVAGRGATEIGARLGKLLASGTS